MKDFFRNMLICLTVAAVFLFLTEGAFAGEIHEAAQKGDMKKVERFLNENPELLNVGDASQGRAPLHWAAFGGDAKLVGFLISKGANVHAKDNDGQTPLHLAATPEVAQLLVERGSDVTARDNYGRTPLHYAAYYGRDKLGQYLISVRAEVNCADENGYTPLIWAVENNHKELLILLISSGADVNARTREGVSPLQIAKKKGYKEIKEILLTHEAID